MKSIKVKTTDLSVTVRVAYQFSFDDFVSYVIELTSQVLITILCNLLRCSMYLQLSWLVQKNTLKGCIWLSDIILKEGQK